MSQVIGKTNKQAAKMLAGPTFWVVSAGVTLVCFMSGPFGTFEALPSGFRLFYWGLVVVLTGAVALWAHAFVRVQNWQDLMKITAVGVSFGIAVVGLVVLISLSLLTPIDRYPGHLEIFTYSFPTATIIFMISALLSRNGEASESGKEHSQPALLARLEKYSDAEQVLALSAQDHYVEVVTEMGSELCLMRLNDAIALAAPQEGVQIHRSHWVAIEAIEALETQGTASQVRLTDGQVLKVSQSRLKAVQELIDRCA